MSLKTATMIAMLGVGVSLLLSLATPYIQEAVRTRQFSMSQMSFYLNSLSLVRALLHDGGLILFLTALWQKQKQ